MEIRTDLALEAAGITEESAQLPEGIELKKEHHGNIEATVVKIKTKSAERAVGKPRGSYITVDLTQVLRREKESFNHTAECIADMLKHLLQLGDHLPVLVAGLGNRDVTPDAIGPLTADHILVTRHMIRQMPKQFGAFRPVSAVVPGVLGTTGLESAEMVRAVVQRTEAAAVIAVDAIAARETHRLCSTVQISNTGISPGAGIGNNRNVLSRETVGVPVIAVGVPTVTDAAALAVNLFEDAGFSVPEEPLRRVATGMIVTSSDIDRRIREISRVLSYAINLALQNGISMEELTDLTF